MRKFALAALFALALTAAQAHSVYPGCVNPPANPTGKLWYFDPVNGKTATDWGTYFAANPTDAGAAGDKAHPFKDLGYAFQRGLNGWLAGYPHQALVSTAFFDLIRIRASTASASMKTGIRPVRMRAASTPATAFCLRAAATAI